eukprot:gb/GFBE01056463.1/.p1 GENE.gb/GFBE01056463.1/~~gb/GFBE01056463.1/.p1  ORF type:complete len:1203 (+),score=176.65 gb/GFBE01056463.1/:1-3609(+)
MVLGCQLVLIVLLAHPAASATGNVDDEAHRHLIRSARRHDRLESSHVTVSIDADGSIQAESQRPEGGEQLLQIESEEAETSEEQRGDEAANSWMNRTRWHESDENKCKNLKYNAGRDMSSVQFVPKLNLWVGIDQGSSLGRKFHCWTQNKGSSDFKYEGSSKGGWMCRGNGDHEGLAMVDPYNCFKKGWDKILFVQTEGAKAACEVDAGDVLNACKRGGDVSVKGYMEFPGIDNENEGLTFYPHNDCKDSQYKVCGLVTSKQFGNGKFRRFKINKKSGDKYDISWIGNEMSKPCNGDLNDIKYSWFDQHIYLQSQQGRGLCIVDLSFRKKGEVNDPRGKTGMQCPEGVDFGNGWMMWSDDGCKLKKTESMIVCPDKARNTQHRCPSYGSSSSNAGSGGSQTNGDTASSGGGQDLPDCVDIAWDCREGMKKGQYRTSQGPAQSCELATWAKAKAFCGRKTDGKYPKETGTVDDKAKRCGVCKPPTETAPQGKIQCSKVPEVCRKDAPIGKFRSSASGGGCGGATNGNKICTVVGDKVEISDRSDSDAACGTCEGDASTPPSPNPEPSDRRRRTRRRTPNPSPSISPSPAGQGTYHEATANTCKQLTDIKGNDMSAVQFVPHLNLWIGVDQGSSLGRAFHCWQQQGDNFNFLGSSKRFSCGRNSDYEALAMPDPFNCFDKHKVMFVQEENGGIACEVNVDEVRNACQRNQEVQVKGTIEFGSMVKRGAYEGLAFYQHSDCQNTPFKVCGVVTTEQNDRKFRTFKITGKSGDKYNIEWFGDEMTVSGIAGDECGTDRHHRSLNDIKYSWFDQHLYFQSKHHKSLCVIDRDFKYVGKVFQPTGIGLTHVEGVDFGNGWIAWADDRPANRVPIVVCQDKSPQRRPSCSSSSGSSSNSASTGKKCKTEIHWKCRLYGNKQGQYRSTGSGSGCGEGMACDDDGQPVKLMKDAACGSCIWTEDTDPPTSNPMPVPTPTATPSGNQLRCSDVPMECRKGEDPGKFRTNAKGGGCLGNKDEDDKKICTVTGQVTDKRYSDSACGYCEEDGSNPSSPSPSPSPRRRRSRSQSNGDTASSGGGQGNSDGQGSGCQGANCNTATTFNAATSASSSGLRDSGPAPPQQQQTVLPSCKNIPTKCQTGLTLGKYRTNNQPQGKDCGKGAVCSSEDGRDLGVDSQSAGCGKCDASMAMCTVLDPAMILLIAVTALALLQ